MCTGQVSFLGGAFECFFRILLRLQLGSQHLLARITRKSATALELRLGDQLFAQIKSTALLTEANYLP